MHSATPLGLAFWLERDSRYVDSEGRPLDLSHVPPRSISAVERDGHRVGALLHDESLADEPELIESVSAAAAFALDNARLEAELRAQNEFLTTVLQDRSEPPRHDRHRRPHPVAQPGDPRRERVRQRKRRSRPVLLGRLPRPG